MLDLRALFDVRGLTAVMTGDSGQLGRTMAHALAQAGVQIASLHTETSGTVAESIQESSGRALVSYVITDEKGEVVLTPFGQGPSGFLIYTDSGYMSAQLTSTNRPHFSQEHLLAASDREKAQAADTYIG